MLIFTDSVERMMRVWVRVRLLRVERRVVVELVVVVEPHLLLVVGRARLAPVARAQQRRNHRLRHAHAAAHYKHNDIPTCSEGSLRENNYHCSIC